MADLSLRRLEELLVQLEEVCRQARELQHSVRETLINSRRQDRLLLKGQPERRRTPRPR